MKGYEYEKGKYVVLKDEDFERVDLEATQTVDIQDFVDVDEIDPIFFTSPTIWNLKKAGTKLTRFCVMLSKRARKLASRRL